MTETARRRVVVTGMGAVTPLGLGVGSTWAACRAGTNGVGPITLVPADDLATRIAAEVKNFDADELIGKKEARRSSRCIHFALVATREAVAQSGLDIGSMPDRVGVLIGSGVGGLEMLEKACVALTLEGPRRISPFTIPAMIADMPSGMVSIELGAKGPNFAVVSACSSGAHAIGEAAEWIRRGDATAVIAGGTEAAITRLSIGSFCAMQALSTRNDDAAHASRPFDRDRDGFVMGEGAGILVLEDRDHALARNAPILAEVVGYGATADASHITQPSPRGEGAVRCVTLALESARLDRKDIAYINAHGTSTPLNDAAETAAIRTVYGDSQPPPMSSTKSMHGHLLGAAGAVESIIAISAMRDRFAPPTINYATPDPDCDLDYVPNQGRDIAEGPVMTTSFGFGGHNACLIFSPA